MEDVKQEIRSRIKELRKLNLEFRIVKNTNCKYTMLQKYAKGISAMAKICKTLIASTLIMALFNATIAANSVTTNSKSITDVSSVTKSIQSNGENRNILNIYFKKDKVQEILQVNFDTTKHAQNAENQIIKMKTEYKYLDLTTEKGYRDATLFIVGSNEDVEKHQKLDKQVNINLHRVSLVNDYEIKNLEER